MRQLVTIRTVKELIPIDGADKIELAKVDGWQCVVKKGDFQVDDKGIYFEIDSVLPADDERFAFLESLRIKSMKLRGALSQGLLMPLADFPEVVAYNLGASMVVETLGKDLAQQNLSDLLRVQKYEPPLPIQGEQKGTFPTHLVPKTDQERIQNIPEVLEGRDGREFEITEKLDGTSCTIYHFADPAIDPDGDVPNEMRSVVGACSRNWEMKLDDDNVYAQIVNNHDLVAKLRKLGLNIAIQGEIIGPRIQGNKYKRAQQEFYVFDIYSIDDQQYFKAPERYMICQQLGLLHVPTITRTGPLNLDTVLSLAEGRSQLFDTEREGLVFKHLTEPLAFKAISNKFLLKTGE